METKKVIKKILIIMGIVIIIGCFIFIYRGITQDNNKQLSAQETQGDESIIDENAINEIKANIENLEIQYINDNNKAKEYTENTFLEISKITKDNYKKYFQNEIDYGKYVSEVMSKMCKYSYQLVQDFSKSKIDTKTFSNQMLPFLEQINNFIDYMQDNPSIYFKDTYNDIQSAKYNALQEKIVNSYIFFDMDFAQNLTDIINAYNNKELPTNQSSYTEQAQMVAEGIEKLKQNTSNVELNKFVNNNYSGDVQNTANSILSDINTLSNFSNTYNTTSGQAVSNLIVDYGELLELIGNDLQY